MERSWKRTPRVSWNTWDDAFAPFNFIAATIIVGTGGCWMAGASGSVRHRPYGPAFQHQSKATRLLSPTLLPSQHEQLAQEQPDDIYPFYGYDLIRIYRQGQHCPDGRLRLRSGISTSASTSRRSSRSMNAGPWSSIVTDCVGPFTDYRGYEALLLEGIEKAVRERGGVHRGSKSTVLSSPSQPATTPRQRRRWPAQPDASKRSRSSTSARTNPEATAAPRIAAFSAWSAGVLALGICAPRRRFDRSRVCLQRGQFHGFPSPRPNTSYADASCSTAISATRFGCPKPPRSAAASAEPGCGMRSGSRRSSPPARWIPRA